MKTLYKVSLRTGHYTFVVAEDLNSACSIAEKAAAEVNGNRLDKVSSVEIIATEGRGTFNNTLHIAPEAQPETTYDGAPVRNGGVYS